MRYLWAVLMTIILPVIFILDIAKYIRSKVLIIYKGVIMSFIDYNKKSKNLRVEDDSPTSTMVFTVIGIWLAFLIILFGTILLLTN